jgi:hypothetical protein
MSTITEPLSFSGESLRLLNSFEKSVRDRLVNSLEGHALRQGNRQITANDVRCAVDAVLSEMLEGMSRSKPRQVFSL